MLRLSNEYVGLKLYLKKNLTQNEKNALNATNKNLQKLTISLKNAKH